MTTERQDGRTFPPANARHLIADLHGCAARALDDEEGVRRVMLEAARRAGATVVDETFHRFSGGGITGVVAVKESHLTIHTWPESGYAAVDVFLCGQADPRAALDHLERRLGAKTAEVREQRRGRPSPSPDASRAGGRGMTAVYGVTLIVAMCSIIYELLLAQTLSALLGNTVLRYSVTIGCYLGALGIGAILCNARARTSDPIGQLLRVEIGLSALGGVAVPLFHFMDVGQRFVFMSTPLGSSWETLAPVGFLLATHAVIVAVGLLSGFEVPLLLALGERVRPHSTNRVLGVDYFGALLGSLVFPLVLLRWLGLLATGFLVAAINGAVAVLLSRGARTQRGGWAIAAAGLVVALGLALVRADRIEQYFLKKFYYAADIVDVATLLGPSPDRPEIVRRRSPYQVIDLVRDPWEPVWIYEAISPKLREDEGYPSDLWLYLNRDYQLFSGTDELYHEWFVHAPVQANGRAPRAVLVLGGGDGLVVREALKYPSVRRLVHVEIDPTMVRLADESPLSEMNAGVHADERVRVVQADAFHWLRNSRDRFDAIYVDMPDPSDYGLSLVYSREFYTLVRSHLTPDGFAAIDTPSAACDDPRGLWGIYYNTLRAAGFETVRSMLARVNVRAPTIVGAVERVAAERSVELPIPANRSVVLTGEQTREYMEATFAEELEGNVQEFIVAFPAARQLDLEWHPELAVPCHLFGREHLRLAFERRCPSDVDRAKVNSIFRPVLPELRLVSMRFP